MAIITVSRGSYSMGKAVAEQTARRLGYRLISREVLLDASSRFNVPEIKLERAIHDAPGILDRYRHSRQSYVAYIRSALVERVVDDNVVYHGLAGHLLLKGLPHVLKVRINADMERRIAVVMERDGIPAEEARHRIEEDDRQRRKWTQTLYGQDPWDASLYDLTICIDHLSVENAVDFICQAAATEGFKTTEKNRQKVSDMAIACRVKAALVDEFPNVSVTCEYGNVLVYTGTGSDHGSGKLARKIDRVRETVEGVFHIEIHSGVAAPEEAV
ncbi:MAG: cytidylate kinase-like family protein [Thermodesulfobacteriota bacterium]|nr:cytidylate kinase-like family protein [Thermodesulfobacteriota bacterium]